VIAELLEVPMPTLIADKAYDIRLARNENYEIAQGTDDGGTAITAELVGRPRDAHPEHNNFRKTHEFFLLSTRQDQVRVPRADAQGHCGQLR
jgi:hypothetical protein